MPLSDIFKKSFRKDQTKNLSDKSEAHSKSTTDKIKPSQEGKCIESAVPEVHSKSQVKSICQNETPPSTSGSVSIKLLTEQKDILQTESCTKDGLSTQLKHEHHTSKDNDVTINSLDHQENVQCDQIASTTENAIRDFEQDTDAPRELKENVQETQSNHSDTDNELKENLGTKATNESLAEVKPDISSGVETAVAVEPLDETNVPPSEEVVVEPLDETYVPPGEEAAVEPLDETNVPTSEEVFVEPLELNIPPTEEAAVTADLIAEIDVNTPDEVYEGEISAETERNDDPGVSETIRRLSDFIHETLVTEMHNVAAEHASHPEVSAVIDKLCNFVDVTLEAEMWNSAHGKRTESVKSEEPTSLEELDGVPAETVSEETPATAAPSDIEHIYEELPDNHGDYEHLKNSDQEPADDKSEKLLLDENEVSPRPETPKKIDILTPPEQDSGTDYVPDMIKSPSNFEKFDTVSTTGSMYSEQDDQGIYLPMPDFSNQGNTTNPNWKVGYLRVKLPHKSRGRGKLKVWQKKLVVIQPDEFFEDQKNRSLILSIYQSDSSSSRSHNAAFWKSVCSKTAVIYRSSSRTHPYTFTVADDQGAIVHLAAETETESQEWMASIRNVLWPPSSVMQLEKVLNGNEFEVSIIDNDFAYRAGLLGTYGYLAVTGRKLILCHPQSGHVIQEWYLNTVDKFQLLPMPKEVDMNKVLVMHTSRESSTGCGEIKFFCIEAVAFLQSLASTIHQVLQHHSKEKKGCYEKELEEISHWLGPTAPPSSSSSSIAETIKEEEENPYKVPPRQVRSLLDIPNFIFDRSLYTTGLNSSPPSQSESPLSKLKTSTTNVSTFSEDSGISVAQSSDDFLNCSQTSFTIGNRSLRIQDRASSGSDLSDAYTPPITPDLKRKELEREKPSQTVHE